MPPPPPLFRFPSPVPSPNSGGVYVETYGCQMNTADTEIVHAVLQGAGMHRTKNIDDAAVILVRSQRFS